MSRSAPRIVLRGVADRAGALRWTFDCIYQDGAVEAHVDSTRAGAVVGIHAEAREGLYVGTTGDADLDERLAEKVRSRLEFERQGRVLRAGAA